MYYSRKLKPPQLGLEYLIVLMFLPVVLIILAVWGMRAMAGAIAGIEFLVVVMHLNMYFRTRNPSYLWLMSAFLIVVLFFTYVAMTGISSDDPEFLPLALVMIIAIVIMGYIVLNRKIKWRTRELLELAAMPVKETRDGFTERPLSLGKIDATEHEIESFALFISKNMIAMPYRESQRIIFSLTSSYWKQNGLSRGYEDESWISINKQGDVNVYISKNDYLLYKDNFSFDQLCSNLGHLFIEFFELFRRGEGVRIIDKLNALKLNPLTE